MDKRLDKFFSVENILYITIFRRYIHDIFKISTPLTILPNDPTPEMLPTDDTTVEISPKSNLTIIIVNFFGK